MTAFVEHAASCAPALQLQGMDDFERAAAERYARMAGMDLSREQRLAQSRRHADGAPQRRAPRAG